MAMPPDWPAIQFESRQMYVYALQYLLKYHGESLTIDGVFGTGTRSAVRNFQGTHGLTVNGTAGVETLAALIQTISVGANNDAVRAAQFLMSQFEGTAINGIFSTQFKSLVETFQRKMQLSVDGVVGYNTWRYLFGYTGYNRRVYVSNTNLTSYEMRVNAQYILDYLCSCGWTKNAVCGMLGNMESESFINPGRWENGEAIASKGYGLVQWTPSTNYTNWAQEQSLPVENIDSQLQRILYEVQEDVQWIPTSSYNFSFSTFTQSTQTPYYLACAFLHNYERPANPSQDTTRGTQAQNWYDLLS